MKTLSIERIRKENPFLTGRIIVGQLYLRNNVEGGPHTVEIEITCTGNCYCAEYFWNNDSKFWDLVVND